MSVCATNSVVFDARKVSLSRRKLADNERWAMLNKKTFQEILNALLAQSTSSSSQPSSAAAATALTFALGQRSTTSSSASNKTSPPSGRTTTKGREYDFSGSDRWAPKDDECAATSSNLESDETSARVGCRRIDTAAADDDDYDLGIEDRCAREATDSLHSLPAAASVVAGAVSPFIIGLGGGTGQRDFVLGQSNQAGVVGEDLQGGVGIFIVCAMPPSTDAAPGQYHFAARLLEGAPTARNADGAPKEECMPQARSIDASAAAAFVRTGSEAVSDVTSEYVARKALPRFRVGEKYERVEEEEGSDEGMGRPGVQRHGMVSRSALPVRNRSRILNSFYPSPRSFDLNKVSKICSRKLCFSAGKPALPPPSMRQINPHETGQVPTASETFTSDFAQTSTTTLSTETSRTGNGSLSTEIRSTSDDSNAEIRSTSTAANVNRKHASAEFILRSGTDTGERTQSKNASSTQTRGTVTDTSFSPAHVSTSCDGVRTEVPPSFKDKTNVALPNRTMAPQGAAGFRHSEQSLSLSWSRWMAVDKDVLFCIIEHVLNAEAVASFNSGFCFKSPAPTRKAFSTERPAAQETLPDSSWRNSNREHLHWAAFFRSSQLGGIFGETGNRSFCQIPVEPRARNGPEFVLANRTTENVTDRFVRVESNTDVFVGSQGDPRCAKTRDAADLASVEISRRFAHFRLGRAEKQRHRGTGRRHVAANRKRKCFQYLGSGSGFADRAPDVSSPERETDPSGLTDDDVDRRGEDGSCGEKGVSSFKWKSEMMMRLRVESHRTVALKDNEGGV